jgi:hypothetical protein
MPRGVYARKKKDRIAVLKKHVERMREQGESGSDFNLLRTHTLMHLGWAEETLELIASNIMKEPITSLAVRHVKSELRRRFTASLKQIEERNNG